MREDASGRGSQAPCSAPRPASHRTRSEDPVRQSSSQHHSRTAGPSEAAGMPRPPPGTLTVSLIHIVPGRSTAENIVHCLALQRDALCHLRPRAGERKLWPKRSGGRRCVRAPQRAHLHGDVLHIRASCAKEPAAVLRVVHGGVRRGQDISHNAHQPSAALLPLTTPSTSSMLPQVGQKSIPVAGRVSSPSGGRGQREPHPLACRIVVGCMAAEHEDDIPVPHPSGPTVSRARSHGGGAASRSRYQGRLRNAWRRGQGSVRPAERAVCACLKARAGELPTRTGSVIEIPARAVAVPIGAGPGGSPLTSARRSVCPRWRRASEDHS